MGRDTHGEEFGGQVAAVVDAAVHRDEAVDVRLVLHRRVVQTRVQHDDSERQHVAGVCTCKQTSTMNHVTLA